MDEYTIYCTEEQTRKALELGAPIEHAKVVDTINGNSTRIPEENGEFYLIPTAEQMIGWLESNPQIHHITVWKECVRWDYTFCYKQDGIVKRFDIGSSGNRLEATIAAIDAALEFIQNLKQ